MVCDVGAGGEAEWVIFDLRLPICDFGLVEFNRALYSVLRLWSPAGQGF